eukprot:14496591-Alexandrium_andersonii.AAC.1
MLAHAFGGLSGALAQQVRRTQAHINVYSGQGVCCDGNSGIAARVVPSSGAPDDQIVVLLGWAGVDGALLLPPTPAPAESIPCFKTLAR